MVPGQVEVASVATGPSLLELAQAMRDGVVVRDCELNVDHQGLGGLLAPKILFEVRKGKVTRRLAHTHLEFSTKKVFKDIIAVGGPTTIETLACHSVSGVPPAWAFQAVAAPAVQFREANLVASGLGTSS
jgi:predicted Zn-dependent protease